MLTKNDCINNIVKIVKNQVIENAKFGATSAGHEHCTPHPHYHDEYVKTEIESTLKRIFIDSIIEVKTVKASDMIPQTLIVSVNWSE